MTDPTPAADRPSLDLDAIEPPRWMDGAAAHALALLLARARFGPGVDMGGRDNPMPSEEIAGKRFMQDLIDNGWLNPAEVAALRAELDAARAAIKTLEDQLLPDGA